MSERKEMEALGRKLAEAVGELTALGRRHASVIESLDYRMDCLEKSVRAHRTLLRALPVSAWPPMMAGEFVALWEGEDG